MERPVRLAAGSVLLVGALAMAPPALAGPVVCTTTLEAPRLGSTWAMGPAPVAPVEVARCGTVQTTPELVERRFFTYTVPFARSIDITHQIADLLGISMGGGDGTKVMGFGFPDQAIVWDGTALQNTYEVLLDEQSNQLPVRTGAVASGFTSSLSLAGDSTMLPPAKIRR